MKTNITPTNVPNLLTAAAYVRNETIINGNQTAQLDAMIGQIKDLTTKIKAAAAIIGIVAAGLLFWYIVIEFMWMCYYAGIPM